eukprot:jgi/Undpi1/9888/HiC_scaffold_28.g12342.m1
MPPHLVKIKLDGDLRIMEIPTPPSFDGLVKAVAEAYAVPSGNEKRFSFTYKDSDGDEVRFDTDAELNLALRTSPSPLRVTVKTTSAPTTAGAGRGANSDAGAPSLRSIPSTTGYAVASNVGSICGGDVMADEGDMIMIDLPPREGVEASESMRGDDGRGGGVADEIGKEQEPEEIDAPAAFEVEAAAARDPEGSMLYQKASMRLAKRYKVHLTPTQLWRVMALFQIQGRRLVVYGLAPRRALDMSANPNAASGASSEEEGEGATRGGGGRGNGGGLKRSKSHVARGLVASPVQRLLDLNGVDIPEDEVQPLLEALRVHPRRLVKLSLLPPEAVADFMAATDTATGTAARSLAVGGVDGVVAMEEAVVVAEGAAAVALVAMVAVAMVAQVVVHVAGAAMTVGMVETVRAASTASPPAKGASGKA